jgi:anti-sigma factor RsiW
MRCLDVQSQLSGLYDQELSVAEAVKQGIEAHLTSCSSCHAEWEEWQQVAKWIGEVPDVAPPFGLRDSILAAVATLEQPARLTCAHALDYLHPYIDGELEAARREQVDAHRAACGSCDAAFAEMESYHELFHSIREVAPPADLRRAIYAEVNRLQPSVWERLRTWLTPPVPVRLRWAALPVAAVLLGLVLFPRLQPGPSPAGEAEVSANPMIVSAAPMTGPLIPVSEPSSKALAEKLSAAVPGGPAAMKKPPLTARREVSPRGTSPRPRPRRDQPLRMAVQNPSENPTAPVATAGTPMKFSVPWPTPAPQPDSVAVAMMGPEPAEVVEPLSLDYRRAFGAITSTGSEEAPQPTDLGSSTGPGPAPSSQEEGSKSAAAPTLPAGTGEAGLTEKSVSLPEGGSSAQSEVPTADDKAAEEGPKLPDLGMP